MDARDKNWVDQEEARFEALRAELTAVLQTTRKWTPVGKLQALEVRIVVVPPWENKYLAQLNNRI